jgi:HEAT repeat protein
MDKQTDYIQLELNLTPPDPTIESGKRALAAMLLRCYLKDLESESPRVRRKGAKGLGELGQAARPAITLLESLLEDTDRKVRVAAEVALQAIRG